MSLTGGDQIQGQGNGARRLFTSILVLSQIEVLFPFIGAAAAINHLAAGRDQGVMGSLNRRLDRRSLMGRIRVGILMIWARIWIDGVVLGVVLGRVIGLLSSPGCDHGGISASDGENQKRRT